MFCRFVLITTPRMKSFWFMISSLPAASLTSYMGIGILLDGLFGTGTGSTVLVENIGLLGSTRVGSRRVIQISAGFMIFFSILGKFGALFASIPLTIFAALYCVLFGLVAAVGLSFLQFTNMNSMCNLFIIGVSIFLGLSFPEYFFDYTLIAQHGPAHTGAGWIFAHSLSFVENNAPKDAKVMFKQDKMDSNYSDTPYARFRCNIPCSFMIAVKLPTIPTNWIESPENFRFQI